MVPMLDDRRFRVVIRRARAPARFVDAPDTEGVIGLPYVGQYSFLAAEWTGQQVSINRQITVHFLLRWPLPGGEEGGFRLLQPYVDSEFGYDARPIFGRINFADPRHFVVQ